MEEVECNITFRSDGEECVENREQGIISKYSIAN